MANKERGESSFEVDGKTYTLKFSIDALCHMEEATGKGVVAITREFANLEKIKITTARAALWAALREHHPEVTLTEAGELIPKAGGLPVILHVVSDAMTTAFPQPKGNSTARPQKATGSGLNS